MAEKKGEENKNSWMVIVALVVAMLFIGWALKKSNSGAHSHGGGEVHTH